MQFAELSYEAFLLLDHNAQQEFFEISRSQISIFSIISLCSSLDDRYNFVCDGQLANFLFIFGLLFNLCLPIDCFLFLKVKLVFASFSDEQPWFANKKSRNSHKKGTSIEIKHRRQVVFNCHEVHDLKHL